MEQKARIRFLIRPSVGHLKLVSHQLEGLVFLYALCDDEIKQADSSRMTLTAYEPFTSKFGHRKRLSRSKTAKCGPLNLYSFDTKHCDTSHR